MLGSTRMGLAERVVVTLSGTRHLIVPILLATAFMTTISGKPLDGLLLMLVATALSWDAGMRAREQAAARQDALARQPDSGETGQRRQGDAGQPCAQPSQPCAQPGQPFAQPRQASAPAGPAGEEWAWRPMTRRPRARTIGLGLAGVLVYALIVGSFTRYSWPATAGVVGLGSAVVLVGWGGPIRQRDIPRKLSTMGIVTWGSLLVVGGLWELAALLGQPDITKASYAHPTISALTDPLLASSLGRAVALLIWIAVGWWLVER